MKWRVLSSLPRAVARPRVASLSLRSRTGLDAQVQATTGIIRGTTTDASGNPISADVTIRNTETNFTRTIRSSDAGVFVATLVPLGNYQVTARALGHNPADRIEHPGQSRTGDRSSARSRALGDDARGRDCPRTDTDRSNEDRRGDAAARRKS